MHKSERYIAAAVTFTVTLLLLLFLFFGSMNYDRALLARDSMPEIQEEEIFLEPEILQDFGEEDATENDAPAPVIQGEPEPAPVENTKIVVKGENPKPAPPIEKKVTTKHESPVKATEPKATDEERQKITSTMAKGFSGRNGAPEGSQGTSGAGGLGIGISGNANGRDFLGCPKPDVTLRNPVTVKVAVVINADGIVTSASASGAASSQIRRACEAAARGARWSAKKGAGDTRGTITFNITPR